MTKLLNMCLANESNSRKLRLNFVRWSFFVTFATMIQELPKYENIKDCYDEPLLKYAITLANHFWPFYDKKKRIMEESHVVEDFYMRYQDGKLKKLSEIMVNYSEASEVQETLAVYGFDTAKFWYLCLLVKDFAEGQTIKASTENPTHREELQKIIFELEKLTPNKSYIDKIQRFEPASPKKKPIPQSNIIKTEVDGELTLRIGNGEETVISDGQTLVLIREALSSFLKMMPKRNSSYLDTAPPYPNNATLLGIPYRVLVFYNCMMWFLNQYKPISKVNISIDRRLLISRLVYVLDIDNNPSYYDKNDLHTVEGKIQHLKNTIKRIKKLKLPVQNKYYKLIND